MLKRRFPTGACLIFALTTLTACSGNAGPVTTKDQLSFGVEMARRQLWSEALFRFEQARSEDPNNPRIYNNLAVASEATGRFEEALEYYKKGLDLSPSDRELRGNYSRFLEFYQSFKAETEGEGAEGAEGPSGSASESGSEGASGAGP